MTHKTYFMTVLLSAMLAVCVTAAGAGSSLPKGYHDSSFEFSFIPSNYSSGSLEFTLSCKYEGKKPSINFYYEGEGVQSVMVCTVPVSGKGKFSKVSYALPPLPDGYSIIRGQIKIDEKSSLDIEACNYREFDARKDYTSLYHYSKFKPLLFHAHLGFQVFCPANTAAAFEYAGESGFKACICNPIESADGDILCYHENHKSLRCLGEEENFSLSSKEFAALSTEKLLSFDAGSSKSAAWKGEKMATFEQFAAICAKYGMNPTLSMHPDLSADGWDTVKKTLDEYGLTSHLTIKSFNPLSNKKSHTNLERAYEIFGDSVTYVCDCNNNPEEAIEIMRTIKLGKARKGIEFKSSIITEEIVQKALDCGLFVSVYAFNTDGKALRKYIKWGATEFTSDNFQGPASWMF